MRRPACEHARPPRSSRSSKASWGDRPMPRRRAAPIVGPSLTAMETAMKNDLPLTHFGACELGSLIARREASAREVLEQHIARVQQVNPQLNAMCVDRFEAARGEADRAD